MYDILQWGPFAIKSNILLLLGSILIGYEVIKHHARKKWKSEHEKIKSVVGNSFFIAVVFWKLSIALIHPISIWKTPMSFVYFSGGYRGWIIALIIVFGYTIYQSKKLHICLSQFFQCYGLGFSISNTLYHLVFMAVEQTNVWFHIGQIVVSILLLFYFKTKYESELVFQGIVWLGISQVFLFFFKTVQVPVGLGLSAKQWIFIVVTLLGFISIVLQKRRAI